MATPVLINLQATTPAPQKEPGDMFPMTPTVEDGKPLVAARGILIAIGIMVVLVGVVFMVIP